MKTDKDHFQCCTFGRSVTSPMITSPYLTVTCVFSFLLTFRELHSANFSANFQQARTCGTLLTVRTLKVAEWSLDGNGSAREAVSRGLAVCGVRGSD